jgi:hypothetical protein
VSSSKTRDDFVTSDQTSSQDLILRAWELTCYVTTHIILHSDHRRAQNFSLGVGADPEAVYNVCLVLKTLMKIVSKSPIRHLVKLQGK